MYLNVFSKRHNSKAHNCQYVPTHHVLFYPVFLENDWNKKEIIFMYDTSSWNFRDMNEQNPTFIK